MIGIKKKQIDNLLFKNRHFIYKEIWMMCLTGVFSLIAAFLVYHIWKFNFYTPTDYSGDIVGSELVAGNFISGKWLYESDKVAPLGYHAQSTIMGYWLHAVLLKIVCLFVSDPVLAVNIFYFMGFILIGMTSYAVLRILKLDMEICVLGGILYTQLPYRYLRHESHLWLSAYYFLPLAVLVLYYIISGQIIKENNEKPDKKKIIASMAAAVLLGASDIYYSAFFAFLMAGAGISAALIKKNWKIFLWILPSLAVLGLTLFLVLFPAIKCMLFSGNVSDMALRSESDLDSFGLKWIYMLLPIIGHRIKILADFRQYCDDSFALNNENGYASLGILLSLSFCVSIISILLGKKTKKSEYHKLICNMGLLILMSVLLAVPGGISTLIGALVSTSIRSYNRISIFIAFFCVISLAAILQLVKHSKVIKNRAGRKQIWRCIFMLIGIFGIWEMTSGNYAEKADYEPFQHSYLSKRTDVEKRISSDRKLVNEVERVMPDGSKILQLPIVANTIYSFFPNGAVGTWRHTWKTIFAETTQWSHGDPQGGDTDQWLVKIRTLPVDELVLAAVETGFTGIYLDPIGYEKDEFEQVREVIEKMTGAKPIVSDYGKQLFYDISKYAASQNAKHSKEESAERKDFWLNKFEMYISVNQLYNWKTKAKYKGNRGIVKGGGLQYGPYIELDAGEYLINYYGSNLDKGKYYCTGNFGKKELAVELIAKESDHVILKLILENNAENVEFLLENSSDEKIAIDKLILESP